jgi:adenylate kinase
VWRRGTCRAFLYELPTLHPAVEVLLSASLQTSICRTVRINDAQRDRDLRDSAYLKQAQKSREAPAISILADIEVKQRSDCGSVTQVTWIP